MTLVTTVSTMKYAVGIHKKSYKNYIKAVTDYNYFQPNMTAVEFAWLTEDIPESGEVR